jgi:hypothetical protein
VTARGISRRWDPELELAGLAGLAALALGLSALSDSRTLGFDAGAAAAAVGRELPTTLPAALLVLGATGLEVLSGLVLARWLRSRPFETLAGAVAAGFAAAVLKDAVLLGFLGQVGLFRMPLLLGIDLLVLASAWWVRPVVVRPTRPELPFGSIALTVLVAIAWASPLLLQLASPVVPASDVLPNHVAPAEHLRTFGAFTPLSATQSPIYGPSRTLLGYDGLLGALATLTGLPAVLAVAAFAVPSGLLLGAGVVRLAGALDGPGHGIARWALIAFSLTTPFARLDDVRGTVVVVPLVCLALALLVEASASSAPAEGWRIGSAGAAGLALGAAALVHPVIAAMAAIAVGLAMIARPDRLAAPGLLALVTSAVVAVPQGLTMVAFPLPAVSLAASVLLGLASALVGQRLVSDARVEQAIVRLASPVGVALLIVGSAGLAIVLVAAGSSAAGSPPASSGLAMPESWALLTGAAQLLLVALIVGWIARAPAAWHPIVVAGILVGAVVLMVGPLIPIGGPTSLGASIAYELPKTASYWLPVPVAMGAAAGLARVAAAGRSELRSWLIAVFLMAAMLPLRLDPIDTAYLGEHHLAEDLAAEMHFATTGFWRGYPDTRTLVDQPRQQLIDAVRAEIVGGRIGPETPVLHVARSFQQWLATPLGVFSGVTETDVSLDPEHSIHTIGGRLYGLADLGALAASGTFPYLLLEPAGLPSSTRDLIAGDGYRSVYRNGQGELFALG